METDPTQSQIPPGQTVTRKFPVTGEKKASKVLTKENYRLILESLGGDFSSLTYKDIVSLPSETQTFDIHCVTSWSRLHTTFTGIRLGKFLESQNIKKNIIEELPYVQFEAYSERLHDTSLPLDFAWDGSWLVYEIDNLPLTPQHGFPIRIITPSRYFYKSLKWLKKIRLIKNDRLGFWERNSSYHNDGNPWMEQRFDQSVVESAEEIKQFKNLDSFESFQPPNKPKVFLKCRFDNWEPKSKDLRFLQLKSCYFTGAKLSGIDFSDTNLTLSKFNHADISNACFNNSDLEGADFSKATLKNTTFNNNSMSATTFGFATKDTNWSFEGKRLENVLIFKPSGLLESQIDFLKKCKVRLAGD